MAAHGPWDIDTGKLLVIRITSLVERLVAGPAFP
jgi:hypothetical protein